MAVWLQGNFYTEQDGVKAGSCREGHAQAKNTEKLINDKELTSFRKLTNWSTVK